MILHCLKKLIFVHGIPLEDGQSFVAQADSFRRTNEGSNVMTSGEGLPNNLPPGPPSRSDNE